MPEVLGSASVASAVPVATPPPKPATIESAVTGVPKSAAEPVLNFGMTLKFIVFDVPPPPPFAGVKTVIGTLDPAAGTVAGISAAFIVASIVVAFRTIVGRSLPLKRTIDEQKTLVPVTASLNAGCPAPTTGGLIMEICGACGLVGGLVHTACVMVKFTSLDWPPPCPLNGGVRTVIGTVPVSMRSPCSIFAVNCVGLTKVVRRDTPPNCT